MTGTTRRTNSAGDLRHQSERIGDLAVHANLVMEMRAGRTACGSDVPDDLAALDVLARADGVAAQVTVVRRQAEAVSHDDQVAVVAAVGCRLHRSVGGRKDRLSFLGRDVEA